MRFEWNDNKNTLNVMKHSVSFYQAQYAFSDRYRVIAEDISHSTMTEKRYFCFGQVDGKVMTVRFTYRGDVIRIIGAGYWRKGVKIYGRQKR